MVLINKYFNAYILHMGFCGPEIGIKIAKFIAPIDLGIYINNKILYYSFGEKLAHKIPQVNDGFVFTNIIKK